MPQVTAQWAALKPEFDTAHIADEVARYGVRTYLAMKDLADQETLQAVTVECFHDHLGGPCLGCSLFNDQGVAASCESDVPGALLMSAGQLLSGAPTFHVDIIKADLARGEAILHHCGNLPRRLAEHRSASGCSGDSRAHRPRARMGRRCRRRWPLDRSPSPTSSAGVARCACARWRPRPSPYTLEFPGSAAKAVFPYDLTEALESIGNAGFGHHFVVLRGHQARDLGEWCALSGVEFLPVTAKA